MVRWRLLQVKNNNKNFPYPVLCKDNDDILNSELNFEYTPFESKNLKLGVKIELVNEKLEELIKEKLATFVIHIECPKTRYRQIFKSKKREFEIEIPHTSLLNSVEISSMIVTEENIKYTNNKFNEDFYNEVFEIGKNKILGYDDDIKIEIERNSDHLENFPSIFSVVKRDDMGKNIGMDLDYSTNKIRIMLDVENYELYKHLREDQQLEKVLASLFILPALVNVLSDYKNLNDLETLNWYHSISLRLNELGISDKEEISNNALKIAQQILGDTFKNSLKTLLERSIGDEE